MASNKLLREYRILYLFHCLSPLIVSRTWT